MVTSNSESLWGPNPRLIFELLGLLLFLAVFAWIYVRRRGLPKSWGSIDWHSEEMARYTAWSVGITLVILVVIFLIFVIRNN